jgi:hypothetical protein
MTMTASPAIAVALAHVEAWSNHDFETARQGLEQTSVSRQRRRNRSCRTPTAPVSMPICTA